MTGVPLRSDRAAASNDRARVANAVVAHAHDVPSASAGATVAVRAFTASRLFNDDRNHTQCLCLQRAHSNPRLVAINPDENRRLRFQLGDTLIDAGGRVADARRLFTLALS